MPTDDKLKEAYEAWRRAVDEHIDTMRNVSDGQPLEPLEMTRQLGEIDTLHATWMEIVLRRDEAAGDAA